MNMLSFLRGRRDDVAKATAATACIEPLREIDWDGRTLTLVVDAEAIAGKDIVLDVDGHFFSAARGEADARARFTFAFSPSGRSDVELLPRLKRDGVPLVDSALRVRFGRAGFARAPSSRPRGLATLAAPARYLPASAIGRRRMTVIVVPVYNAAAEVGRCLESVFAHTQGAARLIIIDDASTEPAIAPLLARYRDIGGVDVLRNPRNLGFTATANRGMREAGGADVVLLNADTEVGPNWLAGLRRAAYANDDIATATAVSDNAGAFSVPELEQLNPLPATWTFEQTARAVWQDAGLAYPELPTGNGFCMYVRREVIDRIGVFDESAFPQGYGEENDFCQRAVRDGWRHVIAGNVLVRHARSRSFGDERRAMLGRAGMAILRERYPDYETDVARTLFSFERRVLDWRIRARFATAAADNAPEPRVLFLDVEHAHASDHAVWCTRACGDDFELVDPAGASVDRVAATARSDAVICWLQRHAIEVLVGDAATIAALADVTAATGVVALTAEADDIPTDLGPMIEQARLRARSFVRKPR